MTAAQERQVLIAEFKRISEHQSVNPLEFDALAARKSIWFHGASPLRLLNDSPPPVSRQACKEM